MTRSNTFDSPTGFTKAPVTVTGCVKRHDLSAEIQIFRDFFSGKEKKTEKEEMSRKRHCGLGKGRRLLLDMLRKMTFTSNLGFEGFDLGGESRDLFFPFQQLLHCF